MNTGSTSLPRQMNRRRWTQAAAAAVLAASRLPALAQADAEQRPPKLPMAVDWPAVPLLDGSVIQPAAWAGQVSVLTFWATWCPFCKRQNAHLDKLYRAVQGQGLRVLAVSVDGDAVKVQRYMQTNHYAFPVALDSAADLRARITERKVIPLTCVIDRQARLTQTVAGEMFEEDVFDLARQALTERT